MHFLQYLTTFVFAVSCLTSANLKADTPPPPLATIVFHGIAFNCYDDPYDCADNSMTNPLLCGDNFQWGFVSITIETDEPKSVTDEWYLVYYGVSDGHRYGSWKMDDSLTSLPGDSIPPTHGTEGFFPFFEESATGLCGVTGWGGTPSTLSGVTLRLETADGEVIAEATFWMYFDLI